MIEVVFAVVYAHLTLTIGVYFEASILSVRRINLLHHLLCLVVQGRAIVSALNGRHDLSQLVVEMVSLARDLCFDAKSEQCRQGDILVVGSCGRVELDGAGSVTTVGWHK